MKRIQKVGIIGLILLFSTLAIVAEAQTNLNSIFDEISYKERVNVSLEFDVNALTSDIRNVDKHPAVFRFKDKNGKLQTWNVKLNLRGKYRRMYCSSMPPIKINFSKKDLAAANLAKFDDMKLVTYCVEDKAIAKELILKEYLAYKIYNEITPESFRVQLLKISYIDTRTGKKQKQTAILIEDTAQLKDRLQANKHPTKLSIPKEEFDQNQVKTAAIFQYMVGNADWDLNSSKNVKMLEKKGKAMAIPYDFDFSGFVNAPYAVPKSNLGLSNVRDRMYLGFEKEATEIKESLQLYTSKRKTIKNLIEDFKLLRPLARKDLVQYIESFYVNLDQIIINPATVDTPIILSDE